MFSTHLRTVAIALLTLLLVGHGLQAGPYRTGASRQRPVQRSVAPPRPVQPYVMRTLPVYAPGINPNAPFYNQVNPFQYVAPGVSTQQYLYNLSQQARVLSRFSPWNYGYNRYSVPVYAGGPTMLPYSAAWPYGVSSNLYSGYYPTTPGYPGYYP